VFGLKTWLCTKSGLLDHRRQRKRCDERLGYICFLVNIFLGSEKFSKHCLRQICGEFDAHDVKSSCLVVSCSILGIFASLMAKNLTFACLNFLIHIDLDMDANPFPLEDRPVRS
jgi:hypothetical protein